MNSLTSVDISWSDFESSLPLFFYLVGITSEKDAMDNLDCDNVLEVRHLKTCAFITNVFVKFKSLETNFFINNA